MAFAKSTGTGFIGNGFYRIHNFATDRYIYVTDDQDYYEKGSDREDFQAIQLWKDDNKAISDPAGIIYIEEVSSGNFDLQAQGTGTLSLTGYYVHVQRQRNGAYEVSASSHGVTKYLSDDETSSSPQGMMGTSNSGDYRCWVVDKIETSHATNYFGISPTIALNGTYYQPFYASFAFRTASPGMHVYYVSDAGGNLALLQEIEGDVPARTPVIIECASSNPSNNRIELLTSTTAQVTDNMLDGVFFCNGDRREQSENAYTVFDAATMRVFAVENGKLVLTDAAPANEVMIIDWTTWSQVSVNCLFANTSYFKADANTPRVIELTSDPTSIHGIPASGQEKSAKGVYSLSGTQLRPGESVQGLPAGLYIVGGKKVVIK